MKVAHIHTHSQSVVSWKEEKKTQEQHFVSLGQSENPWSRNCVVFFSCLFFFIQCFLSRVRRTIEQQYTQWISCVRCVAQCLMSTFYRVASNEHEKHAHWLFDRRSCSWIRRERKNFPLLLYIRREELMQRLHCDKWLIVQRTLHLSITLSGLFVSFFQLVDLVPLALLNSLISLVPLLLLENCQVYSTINQDGQCYR